MIEAVLRRDRVVVAAGLALVTLLAWAWTLTGAGMAMEPGMAMAMAIAPWSLFHASLIFLMWWVMMVAMMVPSASPLILLAAAVQRRSQPDASTASFAALLAAGYLTVWGAFSLAATLLQWSLEQTGLASAMSMNAVPILGGALLIAAGLYQFSPVKRACLRRCRAPVVFITDWYRPGPAGALRLGLVHGAFCLGCCGFLMALLFVGGIMNPVWIAGVAVYVLVEKFVPHGERLSRIVGGLLIGAGFAMLAATIFGGPIT